MVSQYYYLQVLVRVSLICLTAILFAFVLLAQKWFLSVLIFGGILYQTILLIHFFNSTNRKIAFFFKAVENEDFTIHFPENTNNKTVKELNQGLNSINAFLHDIQIKNQSQEKYYQEILKQASIGIVSFTEKGQVVFANPTAEKLLNYKQLNHIKQLQRVDERLYQLFSNLKTYDQQVFQFSNEREQVQLTLKSKPIQLENQNLTLVIIQDIRDELEDKETDSWVRLIKVLTHEIMNSIAPITSLSESILSYYKKEDKIRPVPELNEKLVSNTVKGLEVIKHQGENLIDFVRSYRSLTGIPLPDKQIIPVQQLFEKVQVLVSQERGFDNIDFELKVSPVDLEIFADENQISLVLVNLAKNAIQSLADQDHGKIKFLASLTEDGKKTIQIIDNGPGIKEEILNQIFIPFFTTKVNGSGIGLSFSKQVVRLHNGSLTLSSIPFEETIFTLKL